jgi:CheY-like chemotaxis protein
MELTPRTKILCADDFKDNCDLLDFVLSEAGYQVISVHTISEALQMAQSKEFRLYLIDLSFPDGDGFDLIEKLQAIDPAVPIVVCSGDVREHVRDRTSQLGVKVFLLKPIDTDSLAATIEMILDQEVLM